MIRTPEIIFGYENLARLQIDKGNYDNAREQLKKAIKTIKREKFNEKDEKEVLTTLKNIFEDFIKLGDSASCVETIGLIIKLSDGKINTNSYGEVFIDKFDDFVELSKNQGALEKLLPSDGSAIKRLHIKLQKATSQPENVAEQKSEEPAPEVKAEGNVAQETVIKEKQQEIAVQKEKEAVKEVSGGPSDIIELKLALAKAEMNRKNIESSVRMLNEILVEKPDNAEARNLLNSLRAEEEKKKIIEAAKEKMNRMDLKTPEENEAMSLFLTNELEKANDLVTKAIAKDRENPRLWVIKAFISKKLGKTNLFTNFDSFAKKVDPNITKSKLYAELSKL